MHARKIFMNSPLVQPTVARVRVSVLGGLSQALPRFVDALTPDGRLMSDAEAAGKLPKVVIVAVMRKMITMLNAMVRDNVVWADRLSGRHVLPTAR